MNISAQETQMTQMTQMQRNTEGDLATMAYVRGWRQNNDGRWFKPGVAGTFNSAADAFKADSQLRRGYRRPQD